MIIFNQVSKRYPSGYEALERINLSVGQGEMAFLTGHSGAGKSTLLRLIAMLESPTTGQIMVNGQRLDQLKKREIARYRASLGITLQTPLLLNDRPVFDNVALPLQVQGVAPGTLVKRVHAALDMVGLLPRENMLPDRLSDGERQRVGIARAIVHKPRILLADEPTGNLDAELSKDVMSVFEQLNQAGVGILIATHDLAQIASMKYRIIMLKGGRVCQGG
jgi:cell division transport system ATP-binding protein